MASTSYISPSKDELKKKIFLPITSTTWMKVLQLTLMKSRTMLLEVNEKFSKLNDRLLVKKMLSKTQ